MPRPSTPSLILALLLAGCSGPVAAPAAPPPPSAPWTSADVGRLLDAHLEFLASDDLGGRETGTVHSLVTGQYVAAAMRTAGLQPAGETGWFQTYPLEANRLISERATCAWRDASGVEHALRLIDDFLPGGYGSEGYEVSAAAVFAGHGLVNAELDVDDYAGLDVQGRFAVVLDGRPAGRRDLRGVAHSRAKRAAARAKGAVGLIVLTAADSDDSRQMLESMEDRVKNPVMGMPPEERDPSWPYVVLRPEASTAFLLAGGLDVEAERAARAEQPAPGRELAGVQVQVAAAVDAETTHGANVLGLLPGSDPLLKDEVVIVSAHNDHIGILSDGRVNNGADDNASGTATLLAAAAALESLPAPRRSILFLSVSGEEKGLWGSEWWCTHPTVPIERCVANVNIDMVGRNDPGAVGATPSPEHEAYNTLVTRAVELGPQAGLEITWTAPKDGDDAVDNYYHRSDHYNFAAVGIPVVFFFSGVHEDYHRPTDDVEKIDRAKLRKMVRLVATLAHDVADADERPRSLKQPAE